MIEADRMKAWQLMAGECEDIRRERTIEKAARESGWRAGEVAKALKKAYGTSGH
jgi:hypothetical protein